jgi:serine/threonine-protein kinase
MQIKFNCKYCSAKIGAEDEFCGTTVQCPGCDQPIDVPSAQIGAGTTLGGYRIDKFLGAGAMGEVYLATQLAMGRPVALKIMSKHVAEDEEDRMRFARETRLLAKLDHRNIVTAFEAGVDDGCHFLAMAFIDGVALDERLDREGKLPQDEALDICIKVAEALRYAWDRFQLLHRDVKPANIMIDHRGEVKLMDMGIAKTTSEESSATIMGMVIGTPYYMSPEQARAAQHQDFRSDMYALAATLHHLVTGEYTHSGENPMDVLTSKISEPAPPARRVNPEVTVECEVLLQQFLAVNPDDRPQSWDVAIERLKRVRDGKSPTAQAAVARKPRRRKTRRTAPKTARASTRKPHRSKSTNRTAISLLVAAFLMVGGLFGLAMLTKSPSAKRTSAAPQATGPSAPGKATVTAPAPAAAGVPATPTPADPPRQVVPTKRATPTASPAKRNDHVLAPRSVPGAPTDLFTGRWYQFKGAFRLDIFFKADGIADEVFGGKRNEGRLKWTLTDDSIRIDCPPMVNGKPNYQAKGSVWYAVINRRSMKGFMQYGKRHDAFLKEKK